MNMKVIIRLKTRFWEGWKNCQSKSYIPFESVSGCNSENNPQPTKKYTNVAHLKSIFIFRYVNDNIAI